MDSPIEGDSMLTTTRHPWLRKSARFEEGKHKRDHGKFSSTQGARGQTKPSAPSSRHNPDLDEAMGMTPNRGQSAKPAAADPFAEYQPGSQDIHKPGPPPLPQRAQGQQQAHAAVKSLAASVGKQFAFGKPHKVKDFINAIRTAMHGVSPEVRDAFAEKAGLTPQDTPRQVVEKFYAAFGGKVKVTWKSKTAQPPPLPSQRQQSAGTHHRGGIAVPRGRSRHPWLQGGKR
jgi:hypothetical protein